MSLVGNMTYHGEPLKKNFQNGKPTLLIFNDFNPRAPLISTLVTRLFERSKRFNVIYETANYVTLETVVNTRLHGVPPDYVMAGNTPCWGFASSHKYMKKHGIKFIYMIGDLECAMNDKFQCYIWENMKVDYVTVNFGYPGWSNEDKFLKFLSSHKNLRDAKVFYAGLPINPERYGDYDLDRTIDVAYLSTIGENFEFHDVRRKIRDKLLEIDDLNVLVTNVYDEEYVDVLNKTKILVVDGSMRGALTQKYLEATSCGCFLLGDVPVNSDVFVDWETMIRVWDWDDLKKYIRDWLYITDKRDEMQQECYRRVMDKYDVDKVCNRFEKAILGMTMDEVSKSYKLPVIEYNPPKTHNKKKPVILVMLNNVRYYDHNTCDLTLPDKAPLTRQYYEYLAKHSKDYDIVIESDPLVTIPEVVEKRLGGKPPVCVIKSFGYQYGLLSGESTNYLNDHHIPMYIVMGDIRAFCYNRYHKDLFENCNVTGVLFPLSKRSVCYKQMTDFMKGVDSLRDAHILMRESLVDTTVYKPRKRRKRDVDISVIFSGSNGERKAIVKKIEEFGHAHPEYRVEICNVYGKGYIKALQSTTIFIVHTPEKVSGVSCKYLEAGACGALLMGSVPTTGKGEIFRDTDTMVELDFKGDISDKLLYYLEHEIERNEITNRCREKIIDKYDLAKHGNEFLDSLIKELKRYGSKER